MLSCERHPLEMNLAELLLGKNRRDLQEKLKNIPEFKTFVLGLALSSWVSERLLWRLQGKRVNLGEGFSVLQREREFSYLGLMEDLVNVLNDEPPNKEFLLQFTSMRQ